MQEHQRTLEEKVYKSNNHYSVTKIIKDSLNGYAKSFYLAKQLASRDIKALYRQSLLGFFWAIAPVIMNAAVWIFLQSTGTVRLSDTGIPYPVFVILGTTFWILISECLLLPTETINANKSIITKINFHKEALITLGILKLGFNLLIKLGLVVVFLCIFKILPSASILFFIPVLLFTVIAFVSIGTIISPIGVLYNDIGKALPIAMQLLMYVTPVVYAVPKSGIMKLLMSWNPLSYIIINIRNSLTGGSVDVLFIVLLGIAAIVLALIAMLIYRIAMPVITERMSA
ncbi:MAG: ABC transporter permease [Chitinophagaceae bacterium]|nr:ABC transporter permease [Chitinophagaceae bacterium]MCW5905647.1 ABC transporter permease [Chitinophagaceae bacterium]